MNLLTLPLLFGRAQQAVEGAAPAGGAEQGILSFLPFVLIIAIFYFLIIRPQNKKQKETQKMLEALKKGDKVVTIGGIHGTIHSVKDKTVVLKVDENTKIEFLRSAISSILDPAKALDDKPAAKNENAAIEPPAEKEKKEII
ncbi:MAG: preprotein translocase subunit YajC [Spirochaetaceae bacterium]|jgi:preprotein translocase subunit YajC|nr:preprotein translocase subunit YajC [Spirochaetaceae bacterium]